MASEFIRRMEDLAERCERSGTVTVSGFLTPAEQYELKARAQTQPDWKLVLSGGGADCERQCAFFLPWYESEESFDPEDYIAALEIRSFFGEPGHRDYMGAILGLGIGREWLGDLLVEGDRAYAYCLPSVKGLLLEELDKVGRCAVKVSQLPLCEVPARERKVKALRFTVKSLRLDAVTGEMFSASRTSAAEWIRLGYVSLNYAVCVKTDAAVKPGDVLSVRGRGKGQITGLGGQSRKERLFVDAELYL